MYPLCQLLIWGPRAPVVRFQGVRELGGGKNYILISSTCNWNLTLRSIMNVDFKVVYGV